MSAQRMASKGHFTALRTRPDKEVDIRLFTFVSTTPTGRINARMTDFEEITPTLEIEQATVQFRKSEAGYIGTAMPKKGYSKWKTRG